MNKPKHHESDIGSEWDGTGWDHPTITWNEMLNMMQSAANPKGLRREVEAGCAGRPIARGMVSVSDTFSNGYARFQVLAEEAEKVNDKESVECFTIACILFAVSSIDAALSERIAMFREMEDPDTPPEFWEEVDVTTHPYYQRPGRRGRSEWLPGGCNPGSPWIAGSLRFGNTLRRTFGCGSIPTLSA